MLEEPAPFLSYHILLINVYHKLLLPVIPKGPGHDWVVSTTAIEKAGVFDETGLCCKAVWELQEGLGSASPSPSHSCVFERRNAQTNRSHSVTQTWHLQCFANVPSMDYQPSWLLNHSEPVPHTAQLPPTHTCFFSETNDKYDTD